MTNTTGRLDGVDVSAPLQACLAGQGGALAVGGRVLNCPGLSGALLGPGVHTFEATVTVGGVTLTDTVTWDVKATVE